jgi:hypothetical protein
VSGLVTLAIPCRTDEPALGRTLAAAEASWTRAPESATHALEVLVCLNGPGGARARADLHAFAAAAGTEVVEVDADAGHPRRCRRSPAGGRWWRSSPGAREAARLERAAASRAGRSRSSPTPTSPSRPTPSASSSRSRGRAAAVLASAKTTCAPRAGFFEGIMAAPYGVDFPNLSAQLYAARVAELPALMPEDLIEPERWLELVVGREQLVRIPAARVAVRLPGTLADFFRQRVRIEMGKVQLARDYPGLDARGVRQPRLRAAVANLAPSALGRLGCTRAPQHRARRRLVALAARPDGGRLAAGGDDEELGRRLTGSRPLPGHALPHAAVAGDQIRAYHHLRVLAARHDVTCAALVSAAAAGGDRGDRGDGCARRPRPPGSPGRPRRSPARSSAIVVRSRRSSTRAAAPRRVARLAADADLARAARPFGRLPAGAPAAGRRRRPDRRALTQLRAPGAAGGRAPRRRPRVGGGTTRARRARPRPLDDLPRRLRERAGRARKRRHGPGRAERGRRGRVPLPGRRPAARAHRLRREPRLLPERRRRPVARAGHRAARPAALPTVEPAVGARPARRPRARPHARVSLAASVPAMAPSSPRRPSPSCRSAPAPVCRTRS